jgi:hypothetical protein
VSSTSHTAALARREGGRGLEGEAGLVDVDIWPERL